MLEYLSLSNINHLSEQVEFLKEYLVICKFKEDTPYLLKYAIFSEVVNLNKEIIKLTMALSEP